MSDEDLRAELERLKQENAALKSGAGRAISMKVSEKGGLSVPTVGRRDGREASPVQLLEKPLRLQLSHLSLCEPIGAHDTADGNEVAVVGGMRETESLWICVVDVLSTLAVHGARVFGTSSDCCSNHGV